MVQNFKFTPPRLTTSPPYRKKNGGEVPPYFSLGSLTLRQLDGEVTRGWRSRLKKLEQLHGYGRLLMQRFKT